MLSHTSLEDRLKSGEVRVRYYFLPGDDGKVRFDKTGPAVDLTDTDSDTYRFFKDQLKSDRLGLTLGPIIKSHSHNLITGRPGFRGRRAYSDLRDSGGTLVIGPRETVSLATNERIALGERTAALILPRITLGDAGLLLNCAYIDPYWDGTLQLVLTNSTPFAQSISLLEPIAQCFFFDLAQPASKEFASAFPGKSHHYGQNWFKILEEDAEPFPTRKRPIPKGPGLSGLWGRLRNFWNLNQAALKAVGAVLLLVVGVSGWNSISGPLGRLPELERKVSRMEPYFEGDSSLSVPTLQSAIRDLEKSAVVKGSETITIPAGARAGAREVTVTADLAGSAFVIAQARAAPDTVAAAVVTSIREGKATIRLQVRSAAPRTEPVEVVVDWALIP